MSSMSSNQNVLYTPTECGALKLKNRIVYPAMTRARCPGRTVNSEMVKYYTARSSAGMIVTEPSAVCEGANGYIYFICNRVPHKRDLYYPAKKRPPDS